MTFFSWKNFDEVRHDGQFQQRATEIESGHLKSSFDKGFARFLHLFDNWRHHQANSIDMKKLCRTLSSIRKVALGCAAALSALAAHSETNNIPNRLIDYDTFLVHAADVGRLRNERRLTEERFIEMSAEPGTVVFDARSDDKYAKLHIKGAKHLSFPEITADELAKVFPNKATPILIYCNNNFLNAPGAFAAKMATASLNIHTFNTLYSYGYTNVYELGPLIDIHKAKLQFEGTQSETPPRQ